MVWLLAVWLMSGAPQTEATVQTEATLPFDTVKTVREGRLDFSYQGKIRLFFEFYPWFETFRWQALEEEGQRLVEFVAEVDDVQAVTVFKEKNRYRMKFAFKAMQLEPVYGLDKDKDRLRFSIRFLVTGPEEFRVVSGRLGIRAASTQQWREQALSTKALVKLLEGIFAKHDPYSLLINGLPFR